MHNFYPKGHPSLDLALNNCFNLIKKGVNENSELTLTLDPKGFYAEKQPGSPEQQRTHLACQKILLQAHKGAYLHLRG